MRCGWLELGDQKGTIVGSPVNPNELIYNMKRIAYARVSTPEQRHDRQIVGLDDLCDELYVETLSACSPRRPVYEAVLARLDAGDMLVVWDLDRAFRSVIDALTEADKLQARGVHFHIVSLNVDTTTPTGRFIYTIQSAQAELERQTLSRRTKEGLAAARLRGSRIGRPPTLTDIQVNTARIHLAEEKCTITHVAHLMNVPRSTLSRALRKGVGLRASQAARV